MVKPQDISRVAYFTVSNMVYILELRSDLLCSCLQPFSFVFLSRLPVTLCHVFANSGHIGMVFPKGFLITSPELYSLYPSC